MQYTFLWANGTKVTSEGINEMDAYMNSGKTAKDLIGFEKFIEGNGSNAMFVVDKNKNESKWLID